MKYALLAFDTLQRLTDEKFVPMPKTGARELFLSVFEIAFRDAKEQSRRLSADIAFVALSVPGPFDCENGISQMQHKWPGLKDVPLRQEFARMGVFPEDMAYTFVHDVHGFLVGEKYCGKAAACKNVAAIIIGTGLGFGLWCEDSLLFNETGGVRYSIFKYPCRDGILEDYVSGRAVSGAYQRLTGKTSTAKEIAELAFSGDEEAKQVYSRMGTILGQTVGPLLTKHQIDGVVFGGRLSCAFQLFGKEFAEAAGIKERNVTVYPSFMLEFAAIQGAAAWGKKQLGL